MRQLPHADKELHGRRRTARSQHPGAAPRPVGFAGDAERCTQCHAGRSAEWAAQAVSAWFSRGRQTMPHFGIALHAGRSGAADAEQQLDKLILDRSQPAIARGSALLLLARYASAASRAALTAAIADPDPLVRL